MPTKPSKPARGEIWSAQFNPTTGHEQGALRPVLVISNDRFNQGPSGLIVTVPLTRSNRQQPMHVSLKAPEGGATADCFILCDQVRTMNVERLHARRGVISPTTMRTVEDRLRRLLSL